MAKYTATLDTVIDFHGKYYDAEEFAAAFCGGNVEEAVGAMTVLLNKGKAKPVENKSKEQKTFESVEKEESWKAAADEHDNFVEMNKDYQAQQRREGRATYEQIEFDFPHLLKAQEFQSNMCKDLRIADTEIAIRPGQVVVIFRNVTDGELNYMNRIYKADRFVGATVGVVDTAASKTTDAVHYGATKIVAPMVQVGARAGASIFKTILTTAAKTAGTLITAGSQGIKAAGQEIRHDEDVLRAGRELLEVKDAASRKLSGFGGGAGGARIVR